MRKTLTRLTSIFLFLVILQTHAGPLAPAPQIIQVYDRSFIERSGAQTYGEMLATGILRYFFTGGRELLIMVNGRPYSTTASDLDSLPLSMVERIEVHRAESLGTIRGHAAVRGAFNIVLREGLDGFDVRTVVRQPSRDGGEARQGSVVWGGDFGDGGSLALGVDILDRQEIVGSTRDHSRSEWEEGGSFADAKNVSVGGNTVYVYDLERNLRTVSLGDCNPEAGFTGELINPPGISSGDKGCGYPYGDVWWDTSSLEQKNMILNLRHPVGERAELHMDANVSQGSTAFRYAPSVGVFGILPKPDGNLIDAIKTSADFDVDEDNWVAVGHRFIGHGNRDWYTDFDEYDISAGMEGRLSDSLGYDTSVSASGFSSSELGDTFVDLEYIGEEIFAENYDLADPLSDASEHQAAIDRSRLTSKEDSNARYAGMRLALEGVRGIGERHTAWTAGVEFTSYKADRKLEFQTNDGQTRSVTSVIGSGGINYSGEWETAGAFAETSVPIAKNVDVRVAARFDEYDNIGGLKAWRFGTEYHPTDLVTLRGSWSTGDQVPSIPHLHSTESQDHPFVQCLPESGEPPRTCDTSNYVQVERRTTGNPDLDPSESQRQSLGIEFRRGSRYFLSEWYRLKTLDLPGQNDPTWSVLNYHECPDGDGACIERTGGELIIHDRYANIIDTDIEGVNTRFGARKETSWGNVAMRGFWRYVTESKESHQGVEGEHPLPRNAIRIVNSVGRGDLTAFWAYNYRSKIKNSSGDGHFASWTGHDLTLDWRRPFGFKNTRLTMGVYNVTDEKLTINTANPSIYDGPTAGGWGRTFFMTLNMRF